MSLKKFKIRKNFKITGEGLYQIKFDTVLLFIRKIILTFVSKYCIILITSKRELLCLTDYT